MVVARWTLFRRLIVAKSKFRKSNHMTQPQSQTASLEETIKIAVAHHREGRLHEAENCYRLILASFPHHPDSNHNLGTICRQVGKHAAALPLLQAALVANPANGQYSISYADALVATGNAAQAIDVLKRAAPFNDLNLAGSAEQLVKKAQSMLVPVSPVAPPQVEIDTLVGLFRSRRFAELETGARALIANFPSSGVLWKLLWASLHRQGKESFATLQNAVQLMPQDPELHYNLGVTYAAALKYELAVTSYHQAIELKPDYFEANNDLGLALLILGDLDGAIASFQRALELKPDDAYCVSNMGTAQRSKELFDDAVESFRIASGLKPDNAKIHDNLAMALIDVGELSESLASNARVLELEPEHLHARSRSLYIANFFSKATPAAMLAEARSYGKLVADKAKPFASWKCVFAPDKRMRVGIVSGDLRDHPVGYFVENVLKEIAGNRSVAVEVIVFSNNVIETGITQRIKSCCVEWHMVESLPDEKLAKLIWEREIDILIDLSGHTAANRLPVFAWKPAPVQATWLGYFATTGVEAIDYFIADEYGVAEGEEAFFTEKLWKLPHTRLCFTPPDLVVNVMPPPSLQAGYVTFGCFNKLTKMTEAVVKLWARILEAVPESRLLLKANMLNSESQCRSVIERFAAHGIARERLQLQGPSSRVDYLAAYGQVDIALDPFPFTGGTTTVEALWMGVPVLSLNGDRLLSRQSASILRNVGLDDWIAKSQDEYLAKAIGFAQNINALAPLRSASRQRLIQSPVCDAPRFAVQFEQALRAMWHSHCESTVNKAARRSHDA